MKEVNINITKLDNTIRNLQCLKDECRNTPVKNKEIRGSGKTILTLADIDKEYATISKSIELLIDNTIDFFHGIKESITYADSSATVKD